MNNKTFILTGATSMIGQATAKLLSKQGCMLILIGRSLEKLQNLTDSLSNDSVHFAVDVANESAFNKVMDKILTDYDKIDGIIQNTAIYPYKKVGELSLEEWNQTLKVNLTVPFLVCNKIVPLMKQKKSGKIIFISSIAGELIGLPNMSAYASTKAGINGFMRSLAIELSSFNINVNSISPGKMYDSSSLSLVEQNQLLTPVPLKRFIQPNDIAHMVKFLISENAMNITGQNFIVDGGQSILGEELHVGISG